eukprot:1085331-Heterocapsa_arctica.AAC.1
MAADFNFPPSELRATGWLDLVGGHLANVGQPTCRGKGTSEVDYFVVDARLRGAIVGVACIHDTGSWPHSAIRMWLNGRPRVDMLRTMVAPAKADALLPQGCLPHSASEGWDDIASWNDPASRTMENLNQSFEAWMEKTEGQIADIAGLEAKKRIAFCGRAEGPKFEIRSALGKPSSGTRRYSAVTVAWKTIAVWLSDLVRSQGPEVVLHEKARGRRVEWLLCAY